MKRERKIKKRNSVARRSPAISRSRIYEIEDGVELLGEPFVKLRERKVVIHGDVKQEVWSRYLEASTKILNRYGATGEMPPKTKAGPPKGLLIDMLIPAGRSEDMLLMLDQAYENRWLPKYDVHRAKSIYFVQCTGAVAGYWINWFKSNLKVFNFFAS
jgi:hypothetical protein